SPQQLGGSRIGASAELSKQISSEHLLTISGKYEVARNIFSVADPYWGFESLAGQGLIGRSDWYDFLQPANPNAPLTFPTYDTNGNVVSHGANDCPASYLSSPAPGGCWLYYYNTIVNPGYFKSGVPRIPPNLIGSPENPQDFFAFALRDQMTLGPRLHVDAGIRFDGANNHLPSGLLTGNVGPDDETNYPHVVEPRFSFAYQIDRNDALRFSYGRSVIFPTGGTLYTPLDYRYYLRSFPQGANSLPSDIPGTDFGLGLASNPILPLCGSGLDNAIAPRPCTSYADLIRWEEDYFAPDNGNAKATTYSNLDMTLSHQFRNGFAIKVTPFYKRGYDVAFLGLAKFTIDPTTGAIIPQAFRNVYTGFSKSTGVEVYLSSPERPVGLSGFLSATYVNSLANRPAGLPGEDNSPLVPFQALQAGNVYRSGYDSPLVVKTGFQYQSRGGIRINPVITYDRGYPIGSGLLTPVFINGVALNVPATNNAAALPVQNATGAIAPVFIDPTDPCTVFKPCTYASRGTAETASPGGILSSPRVYANVSLEYSPPKSRATFGVQVINIGNNYYSEPFYNQRYQPVATGVSGPLSGQLDPTGIANYGVVNYSSLQRAYSPYNLFPSATPRTFLFYYQMSL
ncbi:MAG: TonB-dependent receptor, partial [Candidatus Baltobacteraceae bacterium]